MFKKFTAIAMTLVIMLGCAIGVSALCASEEDRPGIVGAELVDIIMELEDSYWNDEIEIPYEARMICVEGYWVVYLEGYDVDDYYAAGFYDHMPNEEEIKILWANRMIEEEFDIACEELGM